MYIQKKSEFTTPIPTKKQADLFSLEKHKGENISESFFELTKHLKKKFNINRGVLCLRKFGSGQLAAVSTWNNGVTRDGLTINLPTESSLFEKVVEDGSVYVEDFCQSFSGNFFERKLLLEDVSRSFVLHPIKFEGENIGLLGYSSEEPTAFTVFEENATDEIKGSFATIVQAYLTKE